MFVMDLHLSRGFLSFEKVLFFIFVSKMCCHPHDLVFIVERSSNITTQEYSTIVDFLYSVTNFMTIGPNHTAISVLTFSSSVRIEFALGDYRNKSDLLEAISALKDVGTDGEADSLLVVTNVIRFYILQERHGARESANKTILFLTKTKVDESIFQPFHHKVYTVDITSLLSTLLESSTTEAVCNLTSSLINIIENNSSVPDACETYKKKKDAQSNSIQIAIMEYSVQDTTDKETPQYIGYILMATCCIVLIVISGLVFTVWRARRHRIRVPQSLPSHV